MSDGTIEAKARRGDVFSGGGEMGALMRDMDWASTPLGPVESWPQSLLTSLSIILRSKFPMFVYWGEELIQLYNDAYVAIPGAKHPQSQGAPARETWAEVWDVVGPMADAVMTCGEATWCEDQLLTMDRHGFTEETYFTFSYSPIQDETGGVGGVFCACTETTERVLAERRLKTVRTLSDRTRGSGSAGEVAERAALAFATAAADIPGALVYLIDGDEATLTADVGVEPCDRFPAHLRLDDPGSPWPVGEVARTLAPAHVADLSSIDVETLPVEPWGRPREAVVLPIVNPTGDAATAALIVMLSPARRFDEAYRSFLVLVADTLGKAMADADAREAERQRAEALAELNRAKTEFFSNVSHEFRTPLTLLLGPLGSARSAGEPLAPRDVDVVHRNAGRLLKLVNSLLEFSRTEAVRLDPTFEYTDLQELTLELADVFRSAVESAGLTYHVACDPLPEPVLVDRDMWERVVLNLLSNALKFTLDGGIEVRLRTDVDGVVLTVRDSGAGISEEHVPHLFERFYRVPGVESRSHEGSGIGLALVADIVDLHGGRVEVDSRLGEGTAFHVHLPFAHPSLAEAPGPVGGGRVRSADVEREAYVSEATGWLDGETGEIDVSPGSGVVLVVDDNADVRRYVRRLLAPHFDVVLATDGEDALERLRATHVDLVVTDVMMPRMDGFGLLEAIRRDPDIAGTPVIFLSARAGAECAGDGLGAGADDYVIKPFSAAELLSRVRANMEMARLRTRLADEQARADLLSGVTHDMQTPLAIILGALNELATGEHDEELEQTLLRRATARAYQLRGLIRQFLDDARLGAGHQLELNRRTVELDGIVTGLVSTLVRPDRVTVTTAGDTTVEGDPLRLGQIVTALIDNAVRYTAGDVDVHVHATDDGAVEVSVTDQGPALSPHQRERIFQRWYRGVTAPELTGSGLGLHVGRQLAELHGGELTVVAHEGGNRFRLRIPGARSPAAPAGRGPSSVRQGVQARTADHRRG